MSTPTATLQTAFTQLMNIEHPVVLAPMAGVSGGALAARVSRAGGLGLIGGGYGDTTFLAARSKTIHRCERPEFGQLSP